MKHVEAAGGEAMVDRPAAEADVEKLAAGDDAMLARGESGEGGIAALKQAAASNATFAPYSVVNVGFDRHAVSMAAKGARGRARSAADRSPH